LLEATEGEWALADKDQTDVCVLFVEMFWTTKHFMPPEQGNSEL
jgi:hypothetical protein